MNYRLICNTLGGLAFILAGAMVACDFWGWVSYADRDAFHEFALIISGAICAVAGVFLRLAGRGGGTRVLRKEAIAIVGLGWIFATLAGALPYLFCSPALGLSGAVFESASGFTTTGASVMTDIEAFPQDILLWRSATQWLGGGGILVLFVALLSGLGVGSKSLFRHESTISVHEGTYPRIRELASRLWQMYLALTILCVVGMLVLGSNLFDALTFTFAGISTGGFAPYNTSAAGLQSGPQEIWLTLFMAIGGTNFLLLAFVIRKRFFHPFRDEEFRLYISVLLAATAWIFVVLSSQTTGGAYLDSLRAAAFQTVSIMTTTGFSTTDYGVWPGAAQAVLFVLMFVGGCVGSTAGSLKVQRLLILLKSLGQEITQAFRPNQILRIRINGRMVANDERTKALIYLALAFPILLVGMILLAALEPGMDLITVSTAVAATFTNVGPGFGAVGPSGNYAAFHSPALWVLSFLMILGRLEMFAILALFLPSLWKRY